MAVWWTIRSISFPRAEQMTYRCVTPLEVSINTRVLGINPEESCCAFDESAVSSSSSLSLVSSASSRISPISTSISSGSWSSACCRDCFLDTVLYTEAMVDWCVLIEASKIKSCGQNIFCFTALSSGHVYSQTGNFIDAMAAEQQKLRKLISMGLLVHHA